MKLIASEAEFNTLIQKKMVETGNKSNEYKVLLYSSVTGKKLDVALEIGVSDTSQLDMFTESNTEKKEDDNGHSTIHDWIDEWRVAWKGKRNKGMGSKDNCINNMIEFFQLYPEYTRDHVFRARDRYINSLDGDYTYLEQADFFIKKRVVGNEGKFEVRRTMLSYAEEVLMDDQNFGQEEGVMFDEFNPYDDV